MKQLHEVRATSSNLVLLGVSPAEQEEMPTSLTFPSRFNPAYRSVWNRIVTEVEIETDVPAKAWNAAVKKYIRYGLSNNLNPFVPNDLTGNAAAIRYLMFARRKVVKYIDEWNILRRHVPRRSSEQFTVTKTEDGVVVRSSIVLRHIDLTRLKKEFVERMFFRFVGPYSVGKVDWRKRLTTYPIYIGFSSANNFEGVLWYEIHLNKSRATAPLLANDLLFDHDKQFERYIRETMWRPITKVIRFWTLPRVSPF